MKKHGFTLAETLITLAIIGVVAALTIPNMIARHQKREIEVGLQKTYAELSNWFKMAENDFGPFDTWELSTFESSKFAEKYMLPYIKLTRCPNKSKCFAGIDQQLTMYYTPTNTKASDTLVSRIATSYYLADGRALSFYIECWGNNNINKHLRICSDVNGLKGKSIIGQDVFCFVIENNRDPHGCPRNTLCSGTAGSNANQSYLTKNCYKDQFGKSCTILLERNGWKFPDDYPIKF